MFIIITLVMVFHRILDLTLAGFLSGFLFYKLMTWIVKAGVVLLIKILSYPDKKN